jgi:hypothetical protein
VIDLTDLLIWADYLEDQGQDSAALRAVVLCLTGCEQSFVAANHGEEGLYYGDGHDYGFGTGDGYGDGCSGDGAGDGFGDGDDNSRGDGEGDGYGDRYGDGDGDGQESEGSR